MNSLTSLTRRATPRNVPPVLADVHRPAVHQDADAERIGIGDVGAGVTFGPMAQEPSRALKRIAGRKYESCGRLQSATIT